MADDKHPIQENDRLMSLRELHAKYGRPSRERIRMAIRNGTGPKGIIRFGENTSPFLCWESQYRKWLLQHGYVRRSHAPQAPPG